jgi:hypothetical protein
MAEIWGAAIAAVGVATSAYSSSRSRSAARDASRQQQEATDAQVEVAREQLEFGREQYADWREMFRGPLTDLRTMAYEEARPDYLGIAADVGNSFDSSQDVNRRTMSRYGISPTDGAAAASETQYGLGRALATVGGFEQARSQARDQRWNRMASFANLSNGHQANAQNTMNQGFGAMGNAFGNQANLYGANAAQYGAAAAAGAQMAGFGLNQLANLNWGAFGRGGGQSMAGIGAALNNSGTPGAWMPPSWGG